jgi:hypothetical protein
LLSNGFANKHVPTALIELHQCGAVFSKRSVLHGTRLEFNQLKDIRQRRRISEEHIVRFRYQERE